MTFPKPFVISLALFTGAAALLAVQRRSALARADGDFELHESVGVSQTPGFPAQSTRPRPAAVSTVPTPEEILAMNPSELRTAAAALMRSQDPLQSNRLMLVCSRLAELDPDSGVDWLFQLSEDGASSNGFFAAAGFLSTWLADGSHDPAELLASAANAAEREKRLGLLGIAATMMGLDSSTSTRITAALDGAATDSRERTVAAMAESGHSPESAVTRLLALPDTGEQRVALNDVLRNLANEDPAAALMQAERVPFSVGVSAIVGRALEKLVKDQPSAALDYIVSHPGPLQTTDFLKRWDTLLAAAGPDAVRAAAAKVEDADIRSQIIGHAAVGLSYTDPFAAAKLIGGLEADALVMPLWQEVAASFATLPEPRQQEWLQTLPEGPAKDTAIAALKQSGSTMAR